MQHTLIPERLTDDLISGSLRLGQVFRVPFLLDFAICVLDIATVLVKSCHFHCFFNSRDVDS